MNAQKGKKLEKKEPPRVPASVLSLLLLLLLLKAKAKSLYFSPFFFLIIL